MKKLTKVLSIVMLVAMCVSMFAGSAYAAGGVCGNCGAAMVTTPYDAGVTETCGTAGKAAIYHCEQSSCSRYYLDDLADGPAYSKSEIETARIIPATGVHSWTDISASDATCMTTGVKEHKKCDSCGALSLDGTTIVNASAVATSKVAHAADTTSINGEGIAPTCSNPGVMKMFLCKHGCGTYVDQNGTARGDFTIPATGVHTYGDWIIDKAATAYDSGSKYRVCTGCGDIDTEIVDANGVPVEEADYYLELVGASYWKSGMDPITFYSEYYDINVYTGTLKIDGKSIDRESYWANKNGQIILGDNLMSKLSAGKHTAQVVETNSRWIESNTVTFYVAATLKATDTDKHVINSSKNLKFVASDTIVSAKIGGVELTDTDDFNINGKYITLYADFLNDRTAGATYTLTVTTAGGETASTTFKILTTAQASASPRTGDDSNVALWSALVLMSGAAMVAVLPRLKKEQ